MAKHHKRITIQVSVENYARFKSMSEEIGIPLTRLFDKILGNITLEQIKDIIFAPKVEVKLPPPVHKTKEREQPAEEFKVNIKDTNSTGRDKTDDDKPSNFKLKL